MRQYSHGVVALTMGHFVYENLTALLPGTMINRGPNTVHLGEPCDMNVLGRTNAPRAAVREQLESVARGLVTASLPRACPS